MSSAESRQPAAEIIPGYFAVPVSEEQAAASLQLCVLVRREADPVGGNLVILRDTIDGQVFLGCFADCGGKVREWVEIWVQNVDGLAFRSEAWGEAVTNASLDERWRRQFQLFEGSEGSRLTRTGWETAHPRPVFVDLDKLCPIRPVDESNRPWELCTENRLLIDKGLPEYGSSLHRYLYIRELGANSKFVPVTSGAPETGDTVSQASITANNRTAPLNAGGGLMLVRSYSPIGFEDFLDLLSGVPWTGRQHGKAPLSLGPTETALKATDLASPADGLLFLAAYGRWGRVVETFHLRLRLLADAFRAVRAAVCHNQRPLLNLTADSFQVMLSEPGSGLPFLWTARPVLVNPGNAVTLPVEGTDMQLFANAGEAAMSVYHPASVGLSIRGIASVRIRQVFTETGGMTGIEGTFFTQERIAATPRDLMWLRLTLKSARVDLYAHLEDTKALARGEFRFRTVPRRMDNKVLQDLKAAEGVPIPQAPFDILPLLNSPCDLYALAVLAARTLFVDEGNTLPIAIDEVLSLARQVAMDYDESGSLSLRIKVLFESDPRWAKTLGPQRLLRDEITPEEAFALVPEPLWLDVLTAVVRMLPGVGQDSACKDYGDAPRGGIHKVFDESIKSLDDLVLRTRSLVLVDWQFNREIGAIVTDYIANLPDYGGVEGVKAKR